MSRLSSGSPFFPFSARLADTILEHGPAAAFRLFRLDRFPPREREFWRNHAAIRAASRAYACRAALGLA